VQNQPMTDISNALLQKGSEEALSAHRVAQPRVALPFTKVKKKPKHRKWNNIDMKLLGTEAS